VIIVKYNKEKGSILSLKQSHFNAKKIMGMCEMCGINMGAEVHHLQHQSNAGEDGYINMNGVKIHKNNPANLLTLCEKCHDNFHKNDSTIKKNKQHKKIKTTLGIKIYEM
jgi:hypothetical protein